jgi:hypothetical protein
VKKTMYLAFAFALAVVAWPHAPTGAAPRCYPTERFKVLDDQWVLDTLTKLVWQRQASTKTMSWSEAQGYCSNAGLRLPTVKELRSIVDLTLGRPGPAIDQRAFPNMPATSGAGVMLFWTSTPYTYISGNAGAWYVDFYDGTSDPGDVPGSNWVRCVR